MEATPANQRIFGLFHFCQLFRSYWRVHEEVVEYLRGNGLFPEGQFGYRKHHSTPDSVLAVDSTEQARKARETTTRYPEGQFCRYVIMSKAFDMVKHHSSADLLPYQCWIWASAYMCCYGSRTTYCIHVSDRRQYVHRVSGPGRRQEKC
eukprot:scpid101286/ scgid18366/ 